MKLKSLLIVGVPPIVVVGAIAAFNPSVLTWPMVAIIGVVIGVFGAFALRLFEG